MLRVGIIGLGEHMKRSHIQPLCDHPRVRVVGFYDPGLKQDWRIDNHVLQKFDDRDSFYDACDAVFIGTPDAMHFEQLREAVSKNKHVFVEKPIIVNPSDSEQLRECLDEASRKDLRVMSCHPRRFVPAVVALKKWLEDKDVTGIELGFYYHKPVRAAKLGRSLSLDHMSHEYDLVRFLFEGRKSSHRPKLSVEMDSPHVYRANGVVSVDSKDVSVTFTGYRIDEACVYHNYVIVRGPWGHAVMNLDSGILFIDGEEKKLAEKMSFDDVFGQMTENVVKAMLDPESNVAYVGMSDLYWNSISPFGSMYIT